MDIQVQTLRPRMVRGTHRKARRKASIRRINTSTQQKGRVALFCAGATPVEEAIVILVGLFRNGRRRLLIRNADQERTNVTREVANPWIAIGLLQISKTEPRRILLEKTRLGISSGILPQTLFNYPRNGIETAQILRC